MKRDKILVLKHSSVELVDVNVVNKEVDVDKVQQIIGGRIRMLKHIPIFRDKNIVMLVAEEGRTLGKIPSLMYKQTREMFYGNIVFAYYSHKTEKLYGLTKEARDIIRSRVNEVYKFSQIYPKRKQDVRMLNGGFYGYQD